MRYLICASWCCGSEDTVCHLHGRHIELLLADGSVEGQIEFALKHLWNIVEGGLHRVVTAHLVADGLIVAHSLFTLESSALALYSLSGITKFGSNGHYSLLLHVLHGETAIDGSGNLAGALYERIGSNGEVVGREFTELATAGKEEDGKTGHSKENFCWFHTIINWYF